MAQKHVTEEIVWQSACGFWTWRRLNGEPKICMAQSAKQATLEIGMLQYVLTGLAGVALGVAVVRMMQSRGQDNADIDQGQTSGQAISFALLGSIGQGRKLLIGAGLLLAAGAGILLLRGDEPAALAPLNQTVSTGKSAAQLDDVQTMIDRLADRLKDKLITQRWTETHFVYAAGYVS